MKRSIVTAALAGLVAVSGLSLPEAAQAQPFGFEAFFFGEHQYCWYEGGWRGPGWYWCGYAWRRGYGWGGGYGWHGHGRRGYDGHGGDHGGWHGGDHGGGGAGAAWGRRGRGGRRFVVACGLCPVRISCLFARVRSPGLAPANSPPRQA